MKRFTLAVYLISVVYILGLAPSIVQAQPYPNRSIQLVIPMIPGSPLDIPGRLLAEELGKVLGTQVIVLNKPGHRQPWEQMQSLGARRMAIPLSTRMRRRSSLPGLPIRKPFPTIRLKIWSLWGFTYSFH